MIKAQTLKGFRDFLPIEAKKRQYVINILKKVFESYGFEPLETPSLEYEEILLGKYGDEGDKLMYRFEDNGKRKVALRYDQTVPLARVVAQYQNELPMPFKRYQIQNVWRADNTQKGRYREFLQCDADIVGSSSLLSDTEILAITYDSYKKLGLDILIKINDRSLLTNYETKYLSVIDKLDKTTESDIIKELERKGLKNKETVLLLNEVKSIKKSERIAKIEALYEIKGYPADSLKFSPVTVRGLDYYTGLIFEVVLKSKPNSPALGAGGRYDNLIGIFSNKSIPAIGFAVGFDRLMEAMEELKLFPTDLTTTKVLVTVFNNELMQKSLEAAQMLRNKNINTEIYLEPGAKMEKQLKYADKKQIPYAVIIGPDEAKNNTVTVKNLKTREQKTLSFDQLHLFKQ